MLLLRSSSAHFVIGAGCACWGWVGGGGPCPHLLLVGVEFFYVPEKEFSEACKGGWNIEESFISVNYPPEFPRLLPFVPPRKKCAVAGIGLKQKPVWGHRPLLRQARVICVPNCSPSAHCMWGLHGCGNRERENSFRRGVGNLFLPTAIWILITSFRGPYNIISLNISLLYLVRHLTSSLLMPWQGLIYSPRADIPHPCYRVRVLSFPFHRWQEEDVKSLPNVLETFGCVEIQIWAACALTIVQGSLRQGQWVWEAENRCYLKCQDWTGGSGGCIERREKKEGWGLSPGHPALRDGAEPADSREGAAEDNVGGKPESALSWQPRGRLTQEGGRGQWSPVSNAVEKPSKVATEKWHWSWQQGSGESLVT